MPQRDPYRDLAVPTHFNYSNNGDVKPSQTATLFPGTYSGMNLKGNVTLTAGTYIINGGSLNISSGAFVAGTGVTIVLTGSNPNTIATVAINGGAQISLTAPSEGIFEGVLIFQDRRALDNDSGGSINKINGNASSKLQGAIYIPSQALEFTGNSTMNIDCLQFVARRLVFTGNSTVRNTCPSLQGSGAFRGTRVRLVG